MEPADGLSPSASKPASEAEGSSRVRCRSQLPDDEAALWQRLDQILFDAALGRTQLEPLQLAEALELRAAAELRYRLRALGSPLDEDAYAWIASLGANLRSAYLALADAERSTLLASMVPDTPGGMLEGLVGFSQWFARTRASQSSREEGKSCASEANSIPMRRCREFVFVRPMLVLNASGGRFDKVAVYYTLTALPEHERDAEALVREVCRRDFEYAPVNLYRFPLPPFECLRRSVRVFDESAERCASTSVSRRSETLSPDGSSVEPYPLVEIAPLHGLTSILVDLGARIQEKAVSWTQALEQSQPRYRYERARPYWPITFEEL